MTPYQQKMIDDARQQLTAQRTKLEAMSDEGFVIGWDNGLCYAPHNQFFMVRVLGLIHAPTFASEAEAQAALPEGLRNGKGEFASVRTVADAKRKNLADIADSLALLTKTELENDQ